MNKKDMKGCPYMRMKPCVGDECSMYMHMMGSNPQTGQPVDQFGCAIAFTPVLIIENSGQQRGACASIDSMRNVIDKANGINEAVTKEMVNAVNSLTESQNKTREVIAAVGQQLAMPQIPGDT